jgi:DNA uptake protein ComE-like DNA-binding protein
MMNALRALGLAWIVLWAAPTGGGAQSTAPSALPPIRLPGIAYPAPAEARTEPAPALKPLVNINTASVEELNRLGGRVARAIIAGRPYTTIDELVSKRVLTRATFNQIKAQITAK